MRIIFMGTPEFAVESLKKLIKNHCNIVAVVTAPDKPAGRGYKLTPSAVKKYAQEINLKILQPTHLKDLKFIDELKELEADLQIVVAFRMLPEVVWAMPPLGTFNLHASLLPQYRGAAPINWAIINGEKETGLTTFFLQHEIDTGKIILQQKVPILANETAGDLHDKLKIIGANLVLETVKQIESGKINPINQKNILLNAELKIAPKIFKENCKINWTLSAEKINNLIRGLSPFPGAFTLLKENHSGTIVLLKIYKAVFSLPPTPSPVGKIETDNKSYLHIYSSLGYIQIEELQLEGKKRLSVKEFLKGTDFSKYSIINE
ncbi:MAG: methionyl-tRNA formyltransferase [Bacteroidetes bacterium]|nr:methionyl-tRNA formyltransferase [Bacteroidota bacterium]MBV6461533.1 Methionyl-tRNA formyltransferase [Flavobacteriales bacterium]WKZ76472.1 MAG: methionyl-tRNA formyltransferase [Vicingaceae bacterium]NOG94156.1 methionyl-tRNA formyltransferase [Bacteroidota bacterium]CAG0958003.1 methionyl-tRNA formyltransferase [Flavobacteriales bacterium]